MIFFNGSTKETFVLMQQSSDTFILQKSKQFIHDYINKMSSPSYPTRVRKSLASIKGTDQRKSYFYCLKLIAVLPVPPGSDFNTWIYPSLPSTSENAKNWSDDKKFLKPKVIQDIFIASHATACEHQSDFFSFYHRHLNVLIEVFLNFIHQILTKGFERLGQAYPPSQKFKSIQEFKLIQGFKFSKTTEFDFLYQGDKIDKWRIVFDAYKKLNLPAQIANHYWAATNFLNDQQLTMPSQLVERQFQEVSDPIDFLFHSINGHLPWQVNVQKRWFNKKQHYDQSVLPLKGVSPWQGTRYTDRYKPITDYPNPNEQKLLRGQLDPRQPQNKIIYQRSFFQNFTRRSRDQSFKRSYLKYNSQTKIYRLTSTEQKESIAKYGGKSLKLQYINQEQKRKLTRNFTIDGNWIVQFNNNLPHYQYAQALYGSMEQFIKGTNYKGIERPHDYIHYYFGFVLDHPSYSVMSLLFYPYHSWIDAMVQFKLRRANKPDLTTPNTKSADYDFLYGLIASKTAKIPINTSLTVGYNVQIGMDQWYLSGNDKITRSIGGFYPILEWYHLNKGVLHDISSAFCSRDYILTKTGIRTSQQFNQIYQFPKYVELYKQRYAFFPELKDFNYNYTYQIQSKNLDTYASNIPQYLRDMEADIRALNAPKFQSRSKVSNTQKSRSQPQSHSVQQEQQFEQHQLQVRKVLGQGIQIFASRPSNAPNGSNPVQIKLKNILKDLTHEGIKKYPYLSAYDFEQLETYISQGFKVNDLFIFGKENLADHCHKCKENKGRFLDIDQDLRNRVPRIWKYLHLSSTNKVYFDSNKPQLKLESVYQKLKLVPNPTFVDYRFVEGAEEIFVDVQSSVLTKEAKFIRLDAESYSVRTNTIKIIPSKKHSTFHTSFDFYKLFDLDNENERSYFDRYVYKQLRGWVSVGSERVKFVVEIPSFQRILRLTLKITRTDKLEVVLEDKDYEAKVAYYESYHE